MSKVMYQKSNLIKVIFLSTIIFFMFIGCVPIRDTSSSEKALLGHWRSANPEVDLFFSSEGVLRLKNAVGNIDELPYKVKLQDNIKIVVPLSKGGGLDVDTDFIEGQFSQDCTIFTGQARDGISAFSFTYVDDQEKP